MYSSVPTNEFVLKLATHAFVSMVGNEVAEVPLRPIIMDGTPPASDCFDKSKSDNIMWPDWCSNMSKMLISQPLSSRKNIALTFGLQVSIYKAHQVQVL